MRLTGITVLSLAAICFLSSCLREDEEVSFYKFEIRYDEHKLTTLDLFTAPHPFINPAPIVLFIHGGGWCSGDKTEWTARHAEIFVKQGFLCASINYRLSSLDDQQHSITHPIHVRDIAKAIAWIQSNVSSYGGNPQKMILVGHSSGAHLAALAALNQKYLQAEGVDIENIKQVFLLDASSYLNSDQYMPDYLIPYFRAATGNSNPLMLSDFIPLNHLIEYDRFPRFIMVTSSDEYRVSSNAFFTDRLKSQGLDAALYSVDIQDHYAVLTSFPYYSELKCIDLIDLN